MALRKDAAASIDIVETLFAVMVVSIGVMMLSASLPTLLRGTDAPSSPTEDVVRVLTAHGALDLAQAEQRAAMCPQGIGIRLLLEQGDEIVLREPPIPGECDLFVTRVPVLIEMPSGNMPAVLEVSCAE